jgi:acetyl-CoA decarbonylase/synthase complex subunit gamma
MELSQSLLRFPIFALAALVFAGLSRNGVVFAEAWNGAWPLFILGLAAIASGSFLVPLLLPFIPSRAFTAKGWIAGGVVTAALLHGAGFASRMDPYLLAACYLFFPAASAFLALNFTGATTFTSLSGVRKEIRISLPFFIAAAALALAALVFSKLSQWGVI